MRPTARKSQEEISTEWGKLAALREHQIQSGMDVSYRFVLVPCVMELSKSCEWDHVLDVGCGTGFLTRELARRAKHVVGLDPSRENIEIARKTCVGLRHVELIENRIEDYIAEIGPGKFTLAVANMSLMTLVELGPAIQSVAGLLKAKGHFVITITHPCFWPFYWCYADKPWFDYKHEIMIEAEFRISLQSESHLVSTHIHRPLEAYVKELVKSGFHIEELMEPKPTMQVETKYPDKWRYPRFLGIRAKKQ